MKRVYLWIFAGTVAVTALAMVVLQIVYLWQAKQAREHDFEVVVKGCMRKVAHGVELREATEALQHIAQDSTRLSVPRGPQERQNSRPARPLWREPIDGAKRTLTESERRELHQRYATQRALIEEAASLLLTRADSVSIRSRVDVSALDYDLQQTLLTAGITLKFHVRLLDAVGDEIYRCTDYEEKGQDYAFSQELFVQAGKHQGVLLVHFPMYERYLYQNAQYSLLTLILCVLFITAFTGCIYYALREKRLSEMKRDFVNNMTHELKTPVTTIDLAVQMLSEPGMLQIERIVQKHMTIIRSEAQRLRFLIDKVLEISLYEQGKRLFNKRPMDMNRLIREAVATFEVQNNFHNGSIELLMEATEAMASVDRTHFANIVFNLLENAIKYRKPDVEPHFVVRTWNSQGQFCFSLADNGIGIKAKNLKYIFDTYYRVHTKNRHDVKGFGLGLAYVKKIIEVHDATIEVSSTYGVGTTFTVKVPLLPVADDTIEN